MTATPAPAATNPCAGDPGSATDFGLALGAVFRQYLKAAADAADGVPGGGRGYQVLALSAAGVCASQLALAKQLGIDRTVMTYLVDDMERGGLIERQPDPADRRARRLVPTEQGRAVLKRVREKLERAEREILAGLAEEERETLRTLLQRVARHHRATAEHACQAAAAVVQA
ncbi:MarR family winged helix-turn-helix transcriptional regulator [Catellatospora tritici]|uniref:MarR family winged helix-turn-helix transcriptional regulator n=1 Tax=Catellatospora tritici TaxID=2851566 RepID=UPI001C2D3162|nr:MarR family transcriptional regulator [Catellatospora tritici]MBV1853775.1 MarR family transcriptional regulator [Catellatospora tritici]